MSGSLDILVGHKTEHIDGSMLHLTDHARQDWVRTMEEEGPGARSGFKLGVATALALAGKTTRQVDSRTGEPNPFVLDARYEGAEYRWFKKALFLLAPQSVLDYDLNAEVLQALPSEKTAFAFHPVSGLYLTGVHTTKDQVHTDHANLDPSIAEVFAFDIADANVIAGSVHYAREIRLTPLR